MIVNEAFFDYQYKETPFRLLCFTRKVAILCIVSFVHDAVIITWSTIEEKAISCIRTNINFQWYFCQPPPIHFTIISFSSFYKTTTTWLTESSDTFLFLSEIDRRSEWNNVEIMLADFLSSENAVKTKEFSLDTFSL